MSQNVSSTAVVIGALRLKQENVGLGQTRIKTDKTVGSQMCFAARARNSQNISQSL